MTCAGCQDVLGFEDGVDFGVGRGGGHGFEDLAFLLARGVADFQLEHEAVDLRFGEGVGAFLVNGVFGGEDEEGLGQGEGVFADGDLAFLHGFEQGALDLGGGAVDFVGQDEVGEDGAFFGEELAVAGVVNEGAEDVGGQEVGRELDAGEVGLDGAGEGADGEGFGEAGDAFEQDVAVGEQADEEAFDEVLLADDDFADFGAQQADPARRLALTESLRAARLMAIGMGLVENPSLCPRSDPHATPKM